MLFDKMIAYIPKALQVCYQCAEQVEVKNGLYIKSRGLSTDWEPAEASGKDRESA